MKTIRTSRKRGAVALFLVFVMTLMYSMPMSVFAADPTGGAGDGKVAYEHEGLPEDQKRVTTFPGGADGSMYESDDNPTKPYQYVYCINESLSATGRPRANADIRWRVNLDANKWLLDNNKRKLTNPDIAPGSEIYDTLVKLLYVGYPYNCTSQRFLDT